MLITLMRPCEKLEIACCSLYSRYPHRIQNCRNLWKIFAWRFRKVDKKTAQKLTNKHLLRLSNLDKKRQKTCEIKAQLYCKVLISVMLEEVKKLI
jgi:hypothetical protein